MSSPRVPGGWCGIRGAAGVAVLGLAFVAGCAAEKFGTAEVTGTVTSKGRPVPGLMVQFTPPRPTGPDLAPPAYGVTDGEGRYTLRITREKWGAVIGPNRVTISIPEREGSSPPPVPPETVSSYASDFDVKPGRNVHDIALE